MDKKYWQERYAESATGWEIKGESTPLINYVLNINKNNKILFPGSGRADDAEYLFRKGYKNIHILDFVEAPLLQFHDRVPDFPENQIHCKDIFSFNEGFDIVIEQTIFCAIQRDRREEFISKIASLLYPEGIYAGVLFNSEFENEGPPFGGSKAEYEELFQNYFSEVQLEECNNSIAPRMGREFFFIAKK